MKETISKGKRQPSEWEKIRANEQPTKNESPKYKIHVFQGEEFIRL